MTQQGNYPQLKSVSMSRISNRLSVPMEILKIVQITTVYNHLPVKSNIDLGP